MRRVIYKFDQDLRLADNPGLTAACAAADQIIPVIEPSGPLKTAHDWWRAESIKSLADSLHRIGSDLIAVTDSDLPALSAALGADIFTPSSHTDLVHNPDGLLKADGTPYRVFTPFYKQWLAYVDDTLTAPLPVPKNDIFISAKHLDGTATIKGGQTKHSHPRWTGPLKQFWQGETAGGPGETGAKDRLAHFLDNHLGDYKAGRDMLGTQRTSLLSPALHHGEISARQMIFATRMADPDGSAGQAFIRQIAWREFAAYILHHFPHTATQPMNPTWAQFPWRNDDSAYEQWCRGETGQSLVDAAMQELWLTGQMHNRARMVTASYLTKNLGIDWRRGAAWFNQTLVDADIANNSMGWQWVAGCGTDAAPYFRIFNPDTQAKKFDADAAYRTRWLGPDWQDRDISPLVDLKASRAEALARYDDMRAI